MHIHEQLRSDSTLPKSKKQKYIFPILFFCTYPLQLPGIPISYFDQFNRQNTVNICYSAFLCDLYHQCYNFQMFISTYMSLEIRFQHLSEKARQGFLVTCYQYFKCLYLLTLFFKMDETSLVSLQECQDYAKKKSSICNKHGESFVRTPINSVDRLGL